MNVWTNLFQTQHEKVISAASEMQEHQIEGIRRLICFLQDRGASSHEACKSLRRAVTQNQVTPMVLS